MILLKFYTCLTFQNPLKSLYHSKSCAKFFSHKQYCITNQCWSWMCVTIKTRSLSMQMLLPFLYCPLSFSFSLSQTHSTSTTERKLSHPCLFYYFSTQITFKPKQKGVIVEICTYQQNDIFQWWLKANFLTILKLPS